MVISEIRRAAACALLLLPSGCAALVETGVTVFHEIEQPLAGASYSIVPSEAQEDSLEFRAYAQLISAELALLGMVEVSLDEAKYTISMSYGMGDGRQVVASYPIMGQIGAGTSSSGTAYGTPSYGVVGYGTRTDTVFTRYLSIDIADTTGSAGGAGRKICEVRAISTGTDGQLAAVMPAIIRSAFEEFPGVSGVPRTVRSPLR